ncbi:hypothetical protein DFH08DRAFT_22617 [Mycena albidolilacea]|uniref:Uncharacterized protein n=1 Tax=Mycena albidolilacea TaxID=1033008 RepID=A0AAD7AV44_9AGAR|nr:hypothetical protein DFH08DRAFT_22617 [Mycena albidolilacea]
MPADDIPSTDFSRFVLNAIKSSSTGERSNSTEERVTQPKPKLDQETLRTALALASSFLVTDTATNSDPHVGSDTWFVGLNQLIDLLVALHARDELEIETVNAASKACSGEQLFRHSLTVLEKIWQSVGQWRARGGGSKNAERALGRSESRYVAL